MATVTEVDVVVLGVGTCGEDLSLQLLDAGLEVAGIEARLVGGECPYWACLPTKRMIRMANLVADARRGDGVVGDVTIESRWPLVAAQVHEEVTGNADDSFAIERFGARGGILVKGFGRLTGPNTVTVNNRMFRARRGVVVATGSSPAIPPIPGLADVDYWTSHDVVAAEALPDSLIVLGGGAVGCELGQLLARFGVAVTIVEAGERIMAAEEPEASEVVTVALEADGIRVLAGRAAERLDGRDGAIDVQLGDGETVSAERLLVATGRKVELGALGLETVGLDPAARFIDVDPRMRAADGLWAVGDVTGKAMFTHVAMYQAEIVVADLLGRPRPDATYHAVPRATFTDPEVGAVGMTEAQARDAGHDVVVVTKLLPATFRGWLHRMGNTGVVKLVVDATSGVLLGGTAVGPHGGEVLGMLSLAVHTRTPITELRSMVYAFPTFHGAIGEAVGAFGRGVGTVLDPDYVGAAALDAIGPA